jgi:hypothetical protein
MRGGVGPSDSGGYPIDRLSKHDKNFPVRLWGGLAGSSGRPKLAVPVSAHKKPIGVALAVIEHRKVYCCEDASTLETKSIALPAIRLL